MKLFLRSWMLCRSNPSGLNRDGLHVTHRPDTRRGIPLALIAGALLGAGAPFSKLLLAHMDPLALAGALYIGPAVVTGLALLVSGHGGRRYAPLRRTDAPRLAAAILAGTIAAPVLLMYGIRLSSGFAASLMLNMEGIATALIAAVFYHEHVSPSLWIAVFCMTATGVLVTGVSGGGSSSLLGALLIMGSCVAWGIETNIVSTLSDRNPVLVTFIECVPSAVLLTLAGALRLGGLPPLRDLLLGVALGSVSNGAGLLLFFLSLEAMGPARTGAFAGIGPLTGAVLSLVLFRTPLDWRVLAGLVLTAAAVLVVGRDDERRQLAGERIPE